MKYIIPLKPSPWSATSTLGLAAAASLLFTPATVLQAQKIYSENFEELALGPNIDEGLAGAHVFTKTPPEGWVRDDSQMPGSDGATDGVTEWSGWGFANKKWWVTTAGDQRRSEWSYGSGTVMIADPDEWDDATHAQGLYNAYITTSGISLAGQVADSLVLTFDSAWRPEGFDDGLPNFPVDADGNKINNQTGIITVTFDDGTPVEILHWDSDSSGQYYKDNSVNEAVVIPLQNPAGAAKLKLKFAMEKAANDWWWSIDNIAIGVPPFVSGITADGVSFTARITEALGKTVNQAKPVTVLLDGAAVTPVTLTQDGDRVLVAYTQAPKVFTPNSQHTVSVTFTSNEGKTITETAAFTAPSYTTVAATPSSVTATITDTDWLTIDESKGVTLKIDGNASVTGSATRADAYVNVTYSLGTNIFASGSSHTVAVTFTTGAGELVTDAVDFTAPTFVTLPAWLGTALTSVSDAGLRWRTYQITTNVDGKVATAEKVLAGQMGPSVHDASAQGTDGFYEISAVNFEKDLSDAGRFNSSAADSLAVPDEAFPGIPGTEGSSEVFVGEARAFVALPQAGIYSMVVNSDDGFQVSAGTTNNPTAYILGAYDATRSAGDTAFYFKVEQAGVYYFRLLYFQGTGGASVEWFTLNPDGSAALVNGTQTGAVKAYRKRTVAEPVAPSSGGIESVALSNGKVVINFTGTLKAAGTIAGPYTAVENAVSPYSATPNETQKFFIAQ
jgi:hypothetical protein